MGMGLEGVGRERCRYVLQVDQDMQFPGISNKWLVNICLTKALAWSSEAGAYIRHRSGHAAVAYLRPRYKFG